MHQIDNLLRRAENQIEEKKVGLSSEVQRKLKLFSYVKPKKEGDEDVCSICLIAAKKGERVYQLTCDHIFHVKCIEPWFIKSHICPNCRRDLHAKTQLPNIPAGSSPQRSRPQLEESKSSATVPTASRLNGSSGSIANTLAQ